MTNHIPILSMYDGISVKPEHFKLFRDNGTDDPDFVEGVSLSISSDGGLMLSTLAKPPFLGPETADYVVTSDPIYTREGER